jgi:hypothetical protein
MWILVALVVIPSIGLAQVVDSGDTQGFSNYLRSGNSYGLGIQPISLLDPSRMTFSHSISSSYISVGGEGVMRNLFMETIGYRISNPLMLTVNLGYLQTPYSSFEPDNTFMSGSFVGSAALTWRPKKNMFLHFEVANYPKYGYGYYNYYPFSPQYHMIDTPATDPGPRTDGLYPGE